MTMMMKHGYWGDVQEDWAGYSGDVEFSAPFFDDKTATVFLGTDFDLDEEDFDMESTPPENILDEYATTYQNFISNLDKMIEDIKQEAFKRYLKIYALYYEDKKKSGKEPLGIDSSEKHFEHMKDLNYLRVLKGGQILILIHYDLDEEHGMEIRLKNNKVIDIGGIAET